MILELGFKNQLVFNLPGGKKGTFQAAVKARAAALRMMSDEQEFAPFHTSTYTHITRVILLIYRTVNEGKIA